MICILRFRWNGGVLTGQSLSFPFIWNVTVPRVADDFAGGGENAIKLATLELKNARAAIASYEQSLYMRLRTASAECQAGEGTTCCCDTD